MPVEKVQTLIIGAGQAGLAMSQQLGKRGLPHLVVERQRIAERWRSERWDGLHANGPAWHDRLSGLPIPGVDPDGFATREQMVNYLVTYAEHFAVPARCGVTVTALRTKDDGTGFLAETTRGVIESANVVAATGPFQRPDVPDIVPADSALMQIHSSLYRNPGQLPEGAVLVVGSGSSGAQIADELVRAGRRVYLCVGRHDRPPRRYRGRDYVWWLGVLGPWSAPREPGSEHIPIAVSGAYGGHTIDFRRLAARGVTLLGRAKGFEDGVMQFAPGLAAHIARGDANHLAVLDAADAYVAHHGLDLPEEPEAHIIDPDPPCLTDPVRSLDLRAAGVRTIIWATGYALDFGWLKAGSFDSRGVPAHQRGVSDVPGLYFLGLSFLSRRASAFIFGVEQDAEHLAEQIAGRVQRGAGL